MTICHTESAAQAPYSVAQAPYSAAQAPYAVYPDCSLWLYLLGVARLPDRAALVERTTLGEGDTPVLGPRILEAVGQQTAEARLQTAATRLQTCKTAKDCHTARLPSPPSQPWPQGGPADFWSYICCQMLQCVAVSSWAISDI